MRTAALFSVLLAIGAVDALRPASGHGIARRHRHVSPVRRDGSEIQTLADGRKCKQRPNKGKAPAHAQNAHAQNAPGQQQQQGEQAQQGEAGANTESAKDEANAPVTSAPVGSTVLPPAASSSAAGENWIGGEDQQQQASSTSTAEDNTATAPAKEHGFGGGIPTTSGGASGLTKKAGVSYIAPSSAWDALKDHLGWFSTYSADPGEGMPGPDGSQSPVFVPILWGGGGNAAEPADGGRLSDFKQLAAADDYVKFAQGFFEPDCGGYMSADMNVDQGMQLWSDVVKPMEDKGTNLISPSMCKQMAETWLEDFKKKGADWKYTNVHINKPDGKSVRAAVDQYLERYGKDLWVSEWACVYDHTGRTCDRADDNQFCPCTDMWEIENYINGTVYLFEHHPRVAAHAFSNGDGLGDQWKLWDKWGGDLTATGQLYLKALKAAQEGSLQVPQGWEEACSNLS